MSAYPSIVLLTLLVVMCNCGSINRQQHNQARSRSLRNGTTTSVALDTIMYKPRECRQQRESGEPWYFCPSHRQGDGVDWPCVRYSDLCNGHQDCPLGEDENTQSCMFHKLLNTELSSLRLSVYTTFEQVQAQQQQQMKDENDF